MSTSVRTASRPAARAARRAEVPYPLDVVYAQAGIESPLARDVEPGEIPPPYRSLLVHERDMTLTLEEHFGGRVTLRALSTFRDGDSYLRRVLLVQDGRQTEMSTDGRKIGDIVEILPLV